MRVSIESKGVYVKKFMKEFTIFRILCCRLYTSVLSIIIVSVYLYYLCFDYCYTNMINADLCINTVQTRVLPEAVIEQEYYTIIKHLLDTVMILLRLIQKLRCP